MSYWLMKSEPNVFSWDDHVKKGVEGWHGVRNHAAAKNLKSMRVGDKAFFYHSNIGKEIVGVMEIIKEAYQDPTDDTGKWVQVDVITKHPMKTPVTLAMVKADPKLKDSALIRYSRLSVQPVTESEWKHICKLGGIA